MNLTGRDKTLETFSKSVGSPVWTYTEIKYLKGKAISYWWNYQKSQSISSVTMSDNLFDKMLTPLPDSDEKIILWQ